MPPEVIFRISDTSELESYVKGEIYALGYLLHRLFSGGGLYVMVLQGSIVQHVFTQGMTTIQDYWAKPLDFRKAQYGDWVKSIDKGRFAQLVGISLADVPLAQKINSIIEKMLEPDYNLRYQAVDDVLADIEGL